MENASKALLIAGGILIAMITISIFFYMFSQISEMKNITDKDTSQEELLAYNQAFESYNKKLMYGADIISVINKAMDNNKRYDVEEPEFYDNIYHVNVTFKLKSELAVTEESFLKNGDRIGTRTVGGTALKKDIVYSINDDYEKIKNVLINAVSRKRRRQCNL